MCSSSPFAATNVICPPVTALAGGVQWSETIVTKPRWLATPDAGRASAEHPAGWTTVLGRGARRTAGPACEFFPGGRPGGSAYFSATTSGNAPMVQGPPQP